MEGATPTNTRIVVVTGGNKGIGLEACKQLAGCGITVVLTARDETRGTAAVEQIKRLGLADVIFHHLDITDASSIARLANFLKTRFGKLDILSNMSQSPDLLGSPASPRRAGSEIAAGAAQPWGPGKSAPSMGGAAAVNRLSRPNLYT